MTQGSDDSEAASRFARACLAVQYLLGRRGDELQVPVGLSQADQVACSKLLRQLSHSERVFRARALASEVAVLVQALQARSVS